MSGDVRNANPEDLECLAGLLWTPPEGGAYSDLAVILTRARSLDVSGAFVALHPLLDWLTDTADGLRDSASRLRADEPPPPTQTQTTSTAVLTASSSEMSSEQSLTSRRAVYEPPESPPWEDDLWTGPEPVPWPPFVPDEDDLWTGPEPVPPPPFVPDEEWFVPWGDPWMAWKPVEEL